MKIVRIRTSFRRIIFCNLFICVVICGCLEALQITRGFDAHIVGSDEKWTKKRTANLRSKYRKVTGSLRLRELSLKVFFFVKYFCKLRKFPVQFVMVCLWSSLKSS